MKHQLPPLPFPKDALLPAISAETVGLHHDRHHAGYVKKLNELVADHPELESLSLGELVQKAPRGKPLFNNAGQAWNHDFLWKSLRPAREVLINGDNTGEPDEGSEISQRIREDFGSFESFREKFETAAKAFFGSGWAWLTLDAHNGKLAIETTANAESPLVTTGNAPLLTCDLWEHAYYVDYRNERAKYLAALWRITNWDFAEANLTHWIERRPAA